MLQPPGQTAGIRPQNAPLPWTVPGELDAWSTVLALVKGRPGRLAAQAAVLAAVVGASVLYSTLDKTVTLTVDGNASEVHAFSKTVGDLLDKQGIKVGPKDIVAPAPSSSLGEGDTVVVRYARPLTLTVDGEKRTYWTTETSVDGALSALGVRADGAQLSASRSKRIDRAGLDMWLSTPKQITLIADGKKRTVTSVAPTVSALLTEQKLTVKPLDKLSTVPTAALRQGSVIKLTRIVKKRVKKTETVAYSVTKKNSSSLYKGTTKVVTKGQNGKRSAVWDLTVADGKVIKRTLVKSSVTDKPVAKVVQVGTKKKPKSSGGGSSDSSGGGTASNDGLNWAALAKCESGGNPKAVNQSGPYYGLYQFSLSTWRAQGGSGLPTDASAGEQTKRAQILYGKTGDSSWPACGPKLHT
jgi:resuscitation-promoting factor RpfB